MYYKLKGNYILRGWDDLPYALVNTDTGHTDFLTSQKFRAMEYCSGKVDISMPFIDDDIREFILKSERNGIAEPCEPGYAITPNQEYKKYPAPYTYGAHWSITGKCNYKCRHCFMSAPDVNSPELSHEDIMKIIDELEDCGIMNVSLTGGEPLIRSDFLDIVDTLRERNINITQIYSNGALVNKNLLTELDNRNIHPQFSMSFDGVGCHDWLRGIPGAEKLVNNAFALCRDMGFPTSCEMVLHKGNKHTLRDSVNHLASLGLNTLKVVMVNSSGEWMKNGLADMSLSIPEFFQICLDYLPCYYSDGMPVNLLLTSFFTASPKSPDEYHIIGYDESYDPDKTFLCGTIRRMTYISPEGRALMCSNLIGTKFERDCDPIISTGEKLSECLRAEHYRKFVNLTARDLLNTNSECRNCKFSKHCSGGCRMVPLLLLGENNLMGKSPTMCELHYGGWVNKIIDTVKKARPSAKLS